MKWQVNKRKFWIYACVTVAIIGALLFLFFGSFRAHSDLTYAEFLKLMNYGAQEQCEIRSVAFMPGSPVLEITLRDKTVRNLVVSDEQKRHAVTLLNQHDIPLCSIAAK